MKWFKHYCNSLSDPFIEELMDEFQATGYLAYFGLIELIGQDNGHILTGKLSVKPSYLKRKLRTSPTKLQQVYDFCQTKGKLLFNICGEYWEFEFAKIAEIKDNYTSDLQVTSKLPSLEKEKRKNKRKSKKEPGKIEPVKLFFGEHKNVRLTKEEIEKLREITHKFDLDRYIENLSDYIKSSGKTYKNHYATLRGWLRRDDLLKTITNKTTETEEEKYQDNYNRSKQNPHNLGDQEVTFYRASHKKFPKMGWDKLLSRRGIKT